MYLEFYLLLDRLLTHDYGRYHGIESLINNPFFIGPNNRRRLLPSISTKVIDLYKSTQ